MTRTTARSTVTIPPATTGPQLWGGYLARGSNGGIFVQITMTTATAFEGSVSLHLEYDDGPVDAQNHFTGMLSKTDVIFHFDDDPAWEWGLSWSGSLVGTGFTVNLPTRKGTLDAAEFRDATVDDYNAAVEEARPLKP